MSNSPDIVGLIGKHVSEMTIGQAKEVEQRILMGENEIEVPYLLGRPARPPEALRKLRYTVPKWHRAPIDRLRIEIARREHRGLDPFPLRFDPIVWFIGSLFILAVADNLGWLPHLVVLGFAFSGAAGVVLYTRWKVKRLTNGKGPFTMIGELEKEIETERLKAADALVTLQVDLLGCQAVETRPDARDAFNRAGQMVESAFRGYVPEGWWRELTEADTRAEQEKG